MKILFLSLFVLISFFLYGQPDTGNRIQVIAKDCNQSSVQKLDSVMFLVYDSFTDQYSPIEVSVYEFDKNGNYSVIEKLSLPTRNRVNKQLYYYDKSGNKQYYVLQSWANGVYTNSSRTDYSLNDKGLLEIEVYSYRGSDGTWVQYQKHIFQYNSENKVESYLRQMRNSVSGWYDFSRHNYFYDNEGYLVGRNEQRVSDGVIFWVEQFDNGLGGKPVSRIRQTLQYFPESNLSQLVNQNRLTYKYDIYGDLSEHHVEVWRNNEWVHSGKSVYFRSLIKGKMVAVCHKGRTIVISVNALKAHLEHGDQIGPCECNSAPLPIGANSEIKPNELQPPLYSVNVFPNPFASSVTVRISEDDGTISRLVLHAKGGAAMLNMDLDGQNQITLNLAHIKAGTYYLSIYGQKGVMTQTLVKK